jgi:hypothetical protein
MCVNNNLTERLHSVHAFTRPSPSPKRNHGLRGLSDAVDQREHK